MTAQASATYTEAPLDVLSRGVTPNGSTAAFNERFYSLDGGINAYQLDLFARCAT